MLTAFGAAAVTFMMVMCALESRGRGFVLAFACGCALSSAYGFLAGTWPFGVVEATRSVIAPPSGTGGRIIGVATVSSPLSPSSRPGPFRFGSTTAPRRPKPARIRRKPRVYLARSP